MSSMRLLKKIAGLFLISRFFVAIFVYYGSVLCPFLAPNPSFYWGVDNFWLNPWTLYDSEWYLRIAARGYESITAVFFPLYAGLLSLAGPDEIRMAFWGVVISNGCFLAALYFLHRLTTIDFDEKVADRTVFLLAFFPTAAFFSAVYTESLFLLLSVLSFYFARKQRWGQAGFWAGLAGLTRNSGWVLFIMLAIEYASYLKDGRRQFRWQEAVSLMLPFLAFAGVMGYFAWESQSLAAGIESQGYFHRSWFWPWKAIQLDLSHFGKIFGEFVGFSRPLDLGALFFLVSLLVTFLLNCILPILALVLIFQYRRHVPLSYAVYILLILSMHLFLARVIFPHTLGTVRYLMVTFPFIQLMAKGSERFDSRPVMRSAGIGLYMGLLIINCIAFGYKFFLG